MLLREREREQSREVTGFWQRVVCRAKNWKSIDRDATRLDKMRTSLSALKEKITIYEKHCHGNAQLSAELDSRQKKLSFIDLFIYFQHKTLATQVRWATAHWREKKILETQHN